MARLKKVIANLKSRSNPIQRIVIADKLYVITKEAWQSHTIKSLLQRAQRRVNREHRKIK